MEIASGDDLYANVDVNHIYWLYHDAGENTPPIYHLPELQRIWGVWKSQNRSYSLFYDVGSLVPWSVRPKVQSLTNNISITRDTFSKAAVEACAKAEGLRYVMVDEKAPGYVRLFYPHDAVKESVDKFASRVMSLKPVSVAVEFLPWEYR